MPLSKKLPNYLLLSFFVMTIAIATPNLVRANPPKLQSKVQIAQAQTTNSDSEQVQIKKAILLNEQKRHWRPQVNILAIADDYAIASVHDQNTGGQSVLKKEQGNWLVICGTGGGFGKAAELVAHCSVPEPIAERLIEIKAAHRRQSH